MAQDTQEIWKDIPGYEGEYQASNLGRIRSLKILKAYPCHGTGYPVVSLGSDGRGRDAKRAHVHYLVAAAFLGPRPVGYHTNHKDGSRDNNNPENLEYITPGENARHSFRLKKRMPLTDRQMNLVEQLYFEAGLSCLAIARKLKVKNKQVRSVIGIWRAQNRQGRKNPYEQKLDLSKAREIRRLYKTGKFTQAELGRLFNVDGSHISRIVNNILHTE